MARTILVIHPGALGDVLLAFRAIQRLRAKFPAHEITLLSREPIGPFLATCRVVDSWISIQGADLTDLFVGRISSGGRLDGLLQTCDVAVVWMKDEDQRIEKGLEDCGVKHIRVRSPFDDGLQARHQSDRFLETLGEMGSPACDDVRLELPADIVQMGLRCLVHHGIVPGGPLVIIHPGSGSRLKCIKPEILAEVIKRFQAEAKQCLLLEGPADREAVESLQRLIHQPIRIIKGVDLSLVAGLLSHAALYIGHDAGITHLSGLVGVPTLALFGPTDPERWAPKGSHVRILRGSPCVCLSWEEVQRCKERTCLAVKPESMLDVCGTIDEFINLPLSMAGCRTLSPPNPYAKVARSISLSLVRT